MPKAVAKTTAQNSYQHSLSIHRLAADIYLGIGEEERSKKQKITVDVDFYIPNALSSFKSDDGEYICYHSISEKIHQLCTSKPFRLIEFLTMEIYRLLRKEVSSEVKVRVTLNKLKILLPYVEGGTSFSYSDLPPFSWVVPR